MDTLGKSFCACALVACALSACSSSGAQLLVDLRTDLRPGADFVGVRTEYAEARPDATSAAELRAEILANSDQDYIDGVRVAEFGQATAGTRWLRVSLVDATGEVMASRLTVVRLSGSLGVTVVITRDCAGIRCPTPSDAPERTTCSGGRCVDPGCGIDGSLSCDPPACAVDSDCVGTVSCARGRCVEGDCLSAADDSRCGVSETCDVLRGCVARPEDGGVDAGPPDSGMTDTGPACPASETACMNGIDDDCDGLIDCADSDCEDASCDDGVWCNGSDSCAAGGCSAHASLPCARFCNETTRVCDACATDTDCGAPSYGGWSACGGFTDTCDTGGTHSRSVTTPRCVAGSCGSSSGSQDEACSRGTDGVSCAATSYGGWGSCGGFSSTCDTSGTQRRNVTTHVCGGGSCGSSTTSQSGSCSRSTNGNACTYVGSCPGICGGGGCAPDGCPAGCPC